MNSSIFKIGKLNIKSNAHQMQHIFRFLLMTFCPY